METKNSAKKCQTLAQAEEDHLAEMSTVSSTKTTTKTKKTTKKSVLKTTANQSIEEGCVIETDEKWSKSSKKKSGTVKKTELEDSVSVPSVQTADTQDDVSEPVSDSTANVNGKKKSKSKKSKKNSTEKQNISVKSSFSKFDALEKRNLINVRSADDGKTSEKFTVNPQEVELVCRLCQKPVYKMEEIKAEKSIFHKNCFRCHECNKQLKVDNYQSHEGVVYCLMHFKVLFAPKSVEEVEPLKPCKPELIIRENQPLELPPDVVRASDKPDLGLEELQQLNVRSRFQVFENGTQKKNETNSLDRTNIPVKRSTSIITKLAKLQALGFSTDLSVNDLAAHAGNSSGNSSSDEDSENSENNGDEDIDLIRSKKKTQRDCPVGLGRAMSDIKSKFENGHIMSKEERREERKQEIQNIRSRLFMGKQARIKEMYQQAVADSEQIITASSKKPDVEIGDGAARNMKERFENGAIFRSSPHATEEMEASMQSGIEKEADVFESAMSKNSRTIFMELDANVAADKSNILPLAPSLSKSNMVQKNQPPSHRLNNETEQENIVKYDEKPEDVKIETSDVSSKFKFFETYRPTESKRKEFRITPPREGVVKLPSPDETESDHKDSIRSVPDANILEKSQTTALMLNKFREMEQNKNKGPINGPRPLKSFTPPPDDGRRLYQDQDSDDQSEDDDYDDDLEEEDYEDNLDKYDKKCMNDEALREAQAAARAKQLRAKFEKWESSETQREQKDGQIDIYSDEVSDQSNIESTKTIRERFENMKNLERNTSGRPRHQVNRFV